MEVRKLCLASRLAARRTGARLNGKEIDASQDSGYWVDRSLRLVPVDADFGELPAFLPVRGRTQTGAAEAASAE